MDDNIASPRKVSRYRSQRQKAQQTLDDAPEVPQIPDEPQQDEGIPRSKSRYHRKNTVGSRPATARESEDVDLPFRPSTKPQSPLNNNSRSPPARYAQRGITQSPSSRHNARGADRYKERHASPPPELGAQDLRAVNEDGYGSGREEERVQSKNAAPVPMSSLSRYQSPSSEPTGELFPPPRSEITKPQTKPVQLDGPPSSAQINATRTTTELPMYHDSEETGGCFGLFKRKRGEASSSAEKLPIARPVSSREPRAILAGGGGIVPGTDAPISAVNAGDRRVLVTCGNSSMLFPVTPTTTPVDLIKSASITMSERIDVKSAVMLEFFGTVGVQRPLRRYEHIRDVMNSWDSDRQNSLLLVDPGTGTSEAELSLAGVPKSKPGEKSWLLSYSQKVGKWEKRFITLKSDGQLVCQKDANKAQDQVVVCHLSDFDIYTPTLEKIKKKVKPPKKLCFAIKSQQKTAMFESTQNFVHFFCTNDRETADGFHDAVQGWRSWYLVNIMGEGVKAKPVEEKPQSPDGKDGGISTSFAAQGQGHKKMDSVGSHYQLGSFRPLIDMDQFDERPGTSDGQGFRPSSSGGAPQRYTSTRRRQQHPPVSLDKNNVLAEDEPLVNLARRTSVDRRRTSIDQKRADEFASAGLLGRSYSQRQREVAEHETQKPQAFTAGHNLLNNAYADPDNSTDGMPRRQASTRQNGSIRRSGSKRDPSGRRGESVDLQRTGSRSGAMPKPLIDLTPTYKEPPQHANKGRGHRAENYGPGNLIEAATSPEDPLGIPSSTDWRGRHAAPPASSNQYLQPSKSVKRPSKSRSPDNGSAFTGEGLLAGSAAQMGWGGESKGRGVIDGSRAKGPMVDLGSDSKFAQGSLLNRVRSGERERY